jgi:hypothetical protein
MNSEQCVMMMTAMKSACQSEAEFFSALTQMSSGAEAPALKAKKSKKSKKAEKASDAAPKEKKEPTAWNLLVSQTVSEMKQSGWESWTDLKGAVWPASLSVVVKDKKGVESEQFVFSSGEHEGKQPSPALGGMARASYLKAQSDPEHAAKVSAYHAKLAEKRSAAASVASAEGSDAEAAPVAVKKSGRPPMTEEQKAAAKLKRAIKKAAEAEAAASAPPASSVPLRGEWAEMEQNEQKEKEE